MANELTICIPGPWQDQWEFLHQVSVHTQGEFSFAMETLANPRTQDHVPLKFSGRDPGLPQAFKIAGQGKLPGSLLDQIAGHKGVLHIGFPLNVMDQCKRLLKFTSLIRDIGGFAVKVDSAGIAHTWETWQALLTSDNPFDPYRCFVVLIADKEHFYSCGMHQFGLPDCQISRQLPPAEAADTMNRFNYYQIVEKPTIEHGNTFSLDPESPCYALSRLEDRRHPKENGLWNPHGLWNMALNNS